MLAKNNVLKIGDLGLAKLLEGTLGRTFAGTRAYMSPEQYKWIRATEEDHEETDELEPFSFSSDVW